jgi:ATP synthase protein I
VVRALALLILRRPTDIIFRNFGRRILMAAQGDFVAVKRILYLQGSVLVFVSALMLGWVGWFEARSAFLGGLAGFLPNLFFASHVLRAKDASARRIVRAFYLGETLKILSTALMFFLILQLDGIEWVPLLAGFVAVILVFWFALLIRDT